MDRTKNYDELKKKITKDLKKHKPKLYSRKVYHAPKEISSTAKVYEAKLYEAKK